MNERTKTLMQELKSGLKETYADCLKGVYLYGSYARGEEDTESDVDALMVLDQFDHYGAEVDRTSKLAANLSLKYDVSLSVVFLREQDWLQGDIPFIVNVREEAISA